MTKAKRSQPTGQARTRYLAWRRRNPAEARQYDRLNAGARANINTLFATPGGARHARGAIRQADEVRREQRRTAAQRRRDNLLPRARAHWHDVSPKDGNPRLELLSQTKLRETLDWSWDDYVYAASQDHDDYGNEYGTDDTPPNPFWYHRSVR